MKRSALAFLLILASLAATEVVLGATPTEACVTITVKEGDSIQAAIDSCPEGGVVVVEDGAYAEHLMIAKSVTLRAAEVSLPTASPTYDPEGFQRDGWSSHPTVLGSVTIQTASVSLRGINVQPREGSIAVDVQAGRASLLGCTVYSLSGQPALVVRADAIVDATTCSLSRVLSHGVVVEPSGVLSVANSFIGITAGHGVVAQGLVTLRGCRIDYCGVLADFESKPEGDPLAGPVLVASDLTHGLVLAETGSASLTNCWITRCRGIGIEARLGIGANVLGALFGTGNVMFGGGPLANEYGRFSPWDQVPLLFYAEEWEQPFDFSWAFGDETFELAIDLQVAGWVFQEPGGQGDWLSDQEQDVARAYSALQGSTTNLAPLVKELLDLADERELSQARTCDFFAAFVHSNVHYDSEKYARQMVGTQYALQTLVQGSGVCRDHSVLLASLLKLAGLDAVYVGLAPLQAGDDGHAIVGVALDDHVGTTVEHDGKRYSLLEPRGGTLGVFVLAHWGEWSVIQLIPVPIVQVQIGLPRFIPEPFGDDLALCVVPLSIHNRGAAVANDVCCAFGVGFHDADLWDFESWRDMIAGGTVRSMSFAHGVGGPAVCLGSLAPGESATFLATGEVRNEDCLIEISAGVRWMSGEDVDSSNVYHTLEWPGTW